MNTPSRFTALWSGTIRPLVVPLILLLLWEVMSHQEGAYTYAFASIEQMAGSLLEIIASGELLDSLRVSMLRAVTGLTLGCLTGLTIGALMAMSRIADGLIGPLYHMLRQVPLLGLAPLLAVWFGNGDPTKLLVVSLAAFYPMVLATYEGLSQVGVQYREVAQVYRLSRWQRFVRVLLPAALPEIFTGLSLALAFCWLSTIGSEILFTAGAGLGNMMMRAQTAARMDVLLVCTVIIGVLGYGLQVLISRVERHVFRWRPAA